MKKIVLAGLFGTFALSGMAQQLPLYSQYYSNPFIFNPSLAGQGEDTRAFLIHKSQWKDIPGAPQTSLLTIDGPTREKNVGLGLSLFNDVTDISTRMGVYSSYSYKIKINDDQNVRLGVSFGVLNSRIDFSRAIVKDANDPLLLDRIESKTTFDGSFGATYNWKTLEVGVAVPQLAGQKMQYLNTESSAYYQLTRHYLGTVKYTFDVNKDKGMTVYPLIMVKYAPGAPVQYDINAVFDWKKIGWAGVTYRSNYAVGMNIGLRLNNTLQAGYAYDLLIGPLSTYTGGAHEIMLGYTFGKKEEPRPDMKAPDPANAKAEAMTDSLLMVLKKNDTQQKQDIDRLTAEVNQLKAGGAGKQPTPPELVSDGAVGIPKVDQLSDYKSANGDKVEAADYIIIGSYKGKENAERARKKCSEMGFPDCQVMTNEKTKLNYLYLAKSPDITQANAMLLKAQGFASDSWVLELK